MSQPQNISTKSAFTRFMLGSILTAYGTARLMRNPRSRMAQGMVVLGAMHAAEGATRYCPSKALGQNMSKNAQGMQGITQMAGNMTQTMTGGNVMKNITNAAQNVVPQVGQLMKDFANATGGGKSAMSNATSTATNMASSTQGKQNQAAGSKTGTAGKAANAYQDGMMPSDGMMQNIADTVIGATSKTNSQSPSITQ